MRLVLFDFDGTLTEGDTLLPFLRYVVGTPAWLAKLARLLPVLGAYACRALGTDKAKEAVLSHFLRGWQEGQLRRLGNDFAHAVVDRKVRAAVIDRYYHHRARGDVCLIVSASLDVYLEPWAYRYGFDAVLCSQLEYRAGRATGRLAGRNCYGVEKVRRIEQWLAGRVPEEIVGYGDSRGDREMLELADRAYIVKRDACISQWGVGASRAGGRDGVNLLRVRWP